MSGTGLDRGLGSGLRRDTALVTVCTLISRITGFGRVLATAAVLGSGLLGDVYQTANMVPNLLFELVAAGVLQAVLLPAFVEARRNGGRDALSSSVQAANGVTMVALASIAALGMLFSPWLTRLMVAADPSSSVASEKLDVMVPMVLVFVPQLVCYGLAAVTSAALNARGKFVAAALAPAVNNVVVIVACLWFRRSRRGVVADLDLTPAQFAIVAGGTTLGVLAYALTPAIVLRRDGVRWWPVWRPQDPAVSAMRSSFGWATLSIVGTLVPTVAALALGNGATGGVAVFVYAFAYFVLPHALVAVPLATTLAPRVADRWQADDVGAIREALASAMRVMVPFLALGTAGMVALAYPLARAAAFGQTASQGIAPIAHALAWFGPGLIGYGISFVMMRVLFAIGDVRHAGTRMIAAALVGVVVMAVASQVAAPQDRAAALALGYGAAQAVAAWLLTRHVVRRTGALPAATMVPVVVEALVAGGCSLAVMLFVVGRFGTSRPDSLAALLVGGAAGVATFVAVVASGRRRLRLGRAEHAL